jgi:hypothetical protein
MPSAWQRLRSWLAIGGGGFGGGGGGGGGFHLWWKDVPAGEPIVACSVVLEVLQLPTVAILYFWALQASFLDANGRSYGAAHTGLQWNPRHPGSRAVNWGGYAQVADVTSILEGSDSQLPGIPGDRNTRTFAWREGVPYRFAIHRGAAGWASTVTDLETGSEVTVRELYAGGDRLGGFVMWSELFCRGTDPPTAVRWSQPEALTASGRIVRPERLQVTFPGGDEWRRLDVVVDEVGVQQRTNAARSLAHNSLVPTTRGSS